MMIFGAPSRYLQGENSLSLIGKEISRLGKKAALIIDQVVNDLYGELIRKSCENSGIKLSIHIFSGECTEQEVDRITNLLDNEKIIVSAGGGKCLDLGKAISFKLSLPIITVPTVASTDAPTSHNYVIYDDSHKLLEVKKLLRNPDLVIVDTSIIAKAPKQLFLAGIGDAIGKVYEVEACVNANGTNIFGGTSSLSALALARFSHSILLENTYEAIRAVEKKTTNDSLEKVVEATVLMSGIAFESGGLSLAHSMTRGLSLVEKYANKLHGFQIAYANLIQLLLEKRPAKEMKELQDFYLKCGLPLSLKDLGGTPKSCEIMEIASGTMTSPHISHFPCILTTSKIIDAINYVENLNG